jgi:hypothetical protein
MRQLPRPTSLIGAGLFVECVANHRVFLPGDAVTHGAITELRNASPLSIEETNQAN